MAARNAGRKLIQEARELQALLQRSKLSLRAIAKRRGKSPAALSQLLAILRLPDDILALAETNPKLASKTKLAMLARVDGAAREEMLAKICAGTSSDTLRNRKRGAKVELSERAQEQLSEISRALRREFAGDLPPGSFTDPKVIEFAIELLSNLWRARRNSVSSTYADFIESQYPESIEDYERDGEDEAEEYEVDYD